MTLQFPNARLLIQDLTLRQKLSGVRALTKGAHEYGLIPFDAIVDINRLENETGCQCRAAAHAILDSYVQAKNKRGGVHRINVDEVRSSFDHDVHIFERKNRREHGQTSEQDQCQRIAPALFDLILQQVHRYS